MPDRERIDSIRRDRDAFDAALLALGSRAKGKSASCPWHDDQDPSASILESADGAWRLHCHVCNRSGDVFDLREQGGGAPIADQLRALNDEPRRDRMSAPTPPMVFSTLTEITASLAGIGRIEDRFEYTNPATLVVGLVVYRIQPADGKKTFRQASPCAGGWRLEAPPKPWPLYNRARVLAAGRVVVVEGEKCVHALHSLGIVATTSPCGAGKAEHADWSPLSGKDVILWPDHDDPGAKHMADVQRMLDALPNPPRLSIVDPVTLGLAAKGDAADLILTFGGDRLQASNVVNEFIEDARPLGASGDVERLLEDAIAGRRKVIPWPWPMLTALSRSLLPGTVTVLCGDPGCGKSFFLLEAAAAWHSMGESVALLEMEEDRAYHLRRVLAQQAHKGALFDEAWTAGHPAEVRELFARHRSFLDEFGRKIFDCPKAMTMAEVATWVENRAAAGARLIIVDPLTAAITGEKSWSDDHNFMLRAKDAAKKFGASVLLAIHPKKGNKGRTLGLDDIAGGAAYQRLAQSILWLESHSVPKSVMIDGRHVEVNRSIAILKARNGPGHGARIGFSFEGHALRFAERGIIERSRVTSADSVRKHHGHSPWDDEDKFDPKARAGGDE
ncbi:MAG: AAA family ATPase [Planctomycetes bacterium]|nr:AAA family ATPase [Planctomycetota bacterium]